MSGLTTPVLSAGEPLGIAVAATISGDGYQAGYHTMQAAVGLLPALGLVKWLRGVRPKCFAAGTLVETPDGPRPIEELRPGDRVLSIDPDTDEVIAAEVSGARTHAAQHVVRVQIGDSEVFATQDHRFQVEARGWVPANALAPGDTLQGADLPYASIVSVSEAPHSADVYDLEVDAARAYLLRVGDVTVVVHNGCGPTGPGVSGRVAPGGAPRPSPKFKPPTNPPQMPPKSVPEGWRVREMPPTQHYPNGYWKLEKPMKDGSWQPIDPSTMKPGSRPETHISFPPKK